MTSNEKWTSALTSYIENDFKYGSFKEICNVSPLEYPAFFDDEGEIDEAILANDNVAYHCSRVLSECLTRRFPDSSQTDLLYIYDTFSEDYRSTSVSKYTFNLQQSRRDIHNKLSGFNRFATDLLRLRLRNEEAYDE